MPQGPVKTGLFVSQIKVGAGLKATPTAGGGVVLLEIDGTESPDAITAGATPFPITGKAPATATSAGGSVAIAGGAGGSTSGNGGVVSVTGGAAATSGNGGIAALIGGAGAGASNGGQASVQGGASGAGATGNGGSVDLTAGSSGATNGAGGTASVVGGAGHGTGNGGAIDLLAGTAGATGNGGDIVLSGGSAAGGVAGNIVERSVKMVHQVAQSTQNTGATLSAAQLLAGILTSNPSGAINLQLPLATAMDTAFPNSVAGDAFDFSVISLAGSTNLPTITTNTGWTLVGAMVFTAVAGNAGRFRAAKTSTGNWTLFRLA